MHQQGHVNECEGGRELRISSDRREREKKKKKKKKKEKRMWNIHQIDQGDGD